MKTLHTYEARPRCYACDERADGARTFHPIGEATQAKEAFDRGDCVFQAATRPVKYETVEGLMAPACKRHADTKVKLVSVCTYCTGPAPHGLVLDGGLVAHVSCERDDCMA